MRSSLMQPPRSGGMEQAQHPQYTTPQAEVRPTSSRYAPVKPAARAAQPHLSLTPAEGWLSMFLLAIAVYAVVISILSTGWVSANSNLLFGTAAGLLVGLLVAKARRLPQVFLHLAACLAGYWLAIWLTSVVAYQVSWLVLLADLHSVICGSLASSSNMVFLFYLTFLCFFLGYFGAWLIYRAHLPWLVALVYCSILLVNLQYVKVDLSSLVIVLLGALLLLIARIQLSNQLSNWMQEGLHTDSSWLRSITTRFMQVTALMTVLILPLSLLLPTVDQPPAGVSLWNAIDNAWVNLTHGQFSLNDPGALFQSDQATTNFFGDQLTITGNVNLPTGPVLYYTSTSSPQSHYLEGFTYDNFDGHTWTSLANSQSQLFPPDQTLPLGDVGAVAQAKTSITVVNPPGGTKSYIFAPDQPQSFSVPISIYSIGMTTAWVQQAPLNVGEHYQVISFIPAVTAQELSTVPLPREAPLFWEQDANYGVLNNNYLQTPSDLSPQVLAVAKQWTKGAANTYDAMEMLVSHFTDETQFTYSVSNSPVPENIDAVSWLLQTRRGYCTYYATAMTMMARLLGVPARIVNGFNQGHFDASRNAWEVDGNNAHSWVQVYFPGHGWIDFDPTPGFSINNITSSQPTPTAGQSPTPVRPTPTATATHPAQGKHPTPTTGSGGSSSNTPNSNDAAHAMLFLGFSLIILLASLLMLAMATYRYRLSKLYANSTFISSIYWRLSRLGSLSGAVPRESQTPYEYTSILCQRFPRAQTALWRITHLFVRERWGAPPYLPGEAEEKDLKRLWPQVRGAMLRSWL